MDDAKRKKLEAQGYWVGDAADFVGLKPHERALLELRLQLRRGVKAARAMNGLTQTQVAKAMGSTQARVAKAESGAAGEVSVEMLIRALYAAGGSVSVHVSPADESPASGARAGKHSAGVGGEAGAGLARATKTSGRRQPRTMKVVGEKEPR